MRTLDVTRLSNKDLGHLCAIEQLKRGVLNEPVVRSLLALRSEVEEQRKEIVKLTNLLKRAVLHPEEANASEIVTKVFPEGKRFLPSVNKGEIRGEEGLRRKTRTVEIDVPDGTIGHLTMECSGNAHDREVVVVTCGSFEKETRRANPHPGAYGNKIECAAKNATDLRTDSLFHSACRMREEDVTHRRNNWVCYDFKERRIVPTHCAIHANNCCPGNEHLKS
jgi:hypothetical protein